MAAPGVKLKHRGLPPYAKNFAQYVHGESEHRSDRFAPGNELIWRQCVKETKKRPHSSDRAPATLGGRRRRRSERAFGAWPANFVSGRSTKRAPLGRRNSAEASRAAISKVARLFARWVFTVSFYDYPRTYPGIPPAGHRNVSFGWPSVARKLLLRLARALPTPARFVCLFVCLFSYSSRANVSVGHHGIQISPAPISTHEEN